MSLILSAARCMTHAQSIRSDRKTSRKYVIINPASTYKTFVIRIEFTRGENLFNFQLHDAMCSNWFVLNEIQWESENKTKRRTCQNIGWIKRNTPCTSFHCKKGILDSSSFTMWNGFVWVFRWSCTFSLFNFFQFEIDTFFFVYAMDSSSVH